jgi:hypothetical protein
MDHACAVAGRAGCQHAGCGAIDCHGEFPSTGCFGVVDPCVGGRIEEEVEWNGLEGFREAVWLREVQFSAGEREEFDVRLGGPCLAQGGPEKTASPEEDRA